MHTRRSWKIEKRHEEQEENWHVPVAIIITYLITITYNKNMRFNPISNYLVHPNAKTGDARLREYSKGFTFEMLSEAEPKIFSRYLAILLFFVFHPRLRRRRRRIYGFCWQWWEENSWQLARTRCHSTIHSKNSFFSTLWIRETRRKDYMVLLCSISLFFYPWYYYVSLSLSPPFFLILERSPRGIKRGRDIFLF